jgi:hypothetical protein
MKTFRNILILMMVLSGGQAMAAQQELAGTWQGKLTVAANQTLTIRFAFTKRPDGSYAVVLNSPDNGNIKDVAASSVSVNADAVKVEVAALSGSFAGTLKGSSLEGQWTQPGGTLPLVLSPYQKVQLSQGAIKTLQGGWYGPLTTPGGSLTFVARFKVDDKGELQGTLAVPEQGGVELPMSDIEFANDKLEFKIPRVQGEYAASYANGAITGVWKQPGTPPAGMPVTLKKGEYAAPVYALKLSTEAFATLAGKWQGKLQVTTPQGQQVSLTLVLRFESNASGQYVGFIDSPDQKAMGLPVAEVTLVADKLTVKVATPNAEYSGTLTGKTLAGQWIQGGMSNPLALTKL